MKIRGVASRILVVDDELGPRESLRMLLKGTYEIRTAENGPSALAQLPDYKPDLVILDIKMPEMSGLEVLRRVKEVDPAIEVVMITATPRSRRSSRRSPMAPSNTSSSRSRGRISTTSCGARCSAAIRKSARAARCRTSSRRCAA